MKCFIKFALASFVILVALFSLWYIRGDFKYKKNDSEFVLQAFEYSRRMGSNSADRDITNFVRYRVRVSTVNEFVEFLERNRINYIIRCDNNKISIVGRYYYYSKFQFLGAHSLSVSAVFEDGKLLHLRGFVFFESI